MRFLDDEQRKQIGLEYVLDQLDILTPMGRKAKTKLGPFGKRKYHLLIQELNDVDIVFKSLNIHSELWQKCSEILSSIKDLTGSFNRAKEGHILSIVELFEIKSFAKLIKNLIALSTDLNLNLSCVKLHHLKEIYDLLNPAGCEENSFYIYDEYSSLLKKIRKDKKNIELSISKEHDESIIKQLLEQRQSIVREEEKHEQKIRQELSIKIKMYFDLAIENLFFVGRLDILLAKAKLAIRYNAIRPIICETSDLALQGSNNPMIADLLSQKNKVMTPVSLELSQGVTLLTGANMGGKSITIKTITLNVMLAQMGFYVFAKSASMPIYDFVYYVSDDMQSVEHGLSTFGAEIIKLKEVLGAVRITKGFIALDEMARGTNPTEGSQIVNGVIHFLKKRDSHILLTTHYDGINKNEIRHYQVIGLKNIDFERLRHKVKLHQIESIDVIQEHMDYRVEEVVGETISKDALKIAELLGLDQEILNWINNKCKE